MGFRCADPERSSPRRIPLANPVGEPNRENRDTWGLPSPRPWRCPVSLRPDPIGPVPDETARVARAAFPKGSRYLRMRDVLGTIFADADFAALDAARGRPVAAPWRIGAGDRHAVRRG